MNKKEPTICAFVASEDIKTGDIVVLDKKTGLLRLGNKNYTNLDFGEKITKTINIITQEND